MYIYIYIYSFSRAPAGLGHRPRRRQHRGPHGPRRGQHRPVFVTVVLICLFCCHISCCFMFMFRTFVICLAATAWVEAPRASCVSRLERNTVRIAMQYLLALPRFIAYHSIPSCGNWCMSLSSLKSAQVRA